MHLDSGIHNSAALAWRQGENRVQIQFIDFGKLLDNLNTRAGASGKAKVGILSVFKSTFVELPGLLPILRAKPGPFRSRWLGLESPLPPVFQQCQHLVQLLHRAF